MRILNRKQLENIRCASKDETRTGLCGLYVDGNKTVTTDGHRLMMVENKKAFPREDWPANGINWKRKPGPFIMDRVAVEKTLKNMNKKHDRPILQNTAMVGLIETEEGKPAKVVSQTTDLDLTENLESRPLGGKFPNYAQVIPDYQDDGLYAKVGVNACYLEEACSILKKYDSGAIAIHFHKEKTENFSIVITAKDGEGTKATSIIMPMGL